ncbi:hypothetical protein ES332_A01G070200v1 [Gossypium tomentosum]|uniref:Uncharacterized protein n=1 Tax=Gossypium tomentosum TaxID=34277 RepID=A0A5D2RQI3_GOSTO|nr:hypothetical protein ES332_A01G070200v1 [Gossypium tomentosum]
MSLMGPVGLWSGRELFKSKKSLCIIQKDAYSEDKGTDQLALAVAGKQHPKATIIEAKRPLIEEGREAIKASIQRNAGIPFESKRLSPGGPDPHHHK